MNMLKSFSIVSLLVVSVSMSCGCTGTQDESVSGATPRIINVINFLRQNDFRIENDVTLLYEAAAEEVKLSKEYGFPTTFLLQYDALVDTAYQVLMKSLPENCEVGGWWEITKPHYEAAGLEWPFEQVWYPYDVLDFGIGHTPEVREKLVDAYMAEFKKIFGYYPKSMGSWYIDSHTLAYMADRYGIKASCVCKEQIGTDGYTLWGGYWNQAFYPSRLNAHIPAQTVEGQIKVPVFRMLGSDPVYQYDDRLGSNGQGVWTMEPVYGSAGADRMWVETYFENFVNEPCLDFNYVQVGQENSFTWKKIGPGLEMQFGIIDSLQKVGLVTLKTLGETGEWFSGRYEVTPATAVTVMKDSRGNDIKTVWFDSRFYRVNLIWEKAGFRFRDIHLFDERVESPYCREAATGTKLVYNALPVVDGFCWSDSVDKAGMSIRCGDGETAVLDTPVIMENGQVMTIACRDLKGNEFNFVLNEGGIEVNGPADVDWRLELYAPQSGLLPFVEISDRIVYARFEENSYSFALEKGLFEKGEGAVAFGIRPDGGSVGIRLACRAE